MNSELLELLKQGDREAFEEMVKTYWDMAGQKAASLTRSWQDAEDLMQESFARAWARVKDFRGDASFGTWLMRIMENHYIDLQRKKGRQPVVAIEDLKTPPSFDLSGLEAKLDTEHLRECLKAALQKLPDVYSKLIILREVQNMSYEEMAEYMACSVESIRCKLYRARRQMKAELSILLGQYEIIR